MNFSVSLSFFLFSLYSADFDFAQVETIAIVQPRIISPSLRCSRARLNEREIRVARHPSTSPRTVRIILIQELTQESIPPERRAASCRSRSKCSERKHDYRIARRATYTFVRTHARTHVRTYARDRVVTLPRAAYVYFRRRETWHPLHRSWAADPSLLFKSRRQTASSHRVEIWEWWKRGRRGIKGDVVPRSASGRERPWVQGMKEARTRCGRGREREREWARGGRGRRSTTMRENRDRDAVMGKTWTKRGASESIAFRNERKGGREKWRTKKEGRRRRNANALSTWVTRRKKKDGIRENRE